MDAPRGRMDPVNSLNQRPHSFDSKDDHMNTQLLADPSRTLPDYKKGNFAHIPGLLSSLLGYDVPTPLSPDYFGFRPGQFPKVVFLFLDAFGWNHFSYFQNRRHRVIQKVAEQGKVYKITSQFPSTTAAHVTTFNTGQIVGEHGVYEWQYFEPEVDEVIYPLLFSFAGEKKRDTLRFANVDPRDLLPTKTLAMTLKEHGITTYSFVPREYTTTSYNQVMAQGAEVTGYRTVAEALSTLKRTIDRASGPALFHFYMPYIDGNAHEFGPFAYQTLAESDAAWLLLDRFLFHPLRKRDDVLIIISADHGQIRVDPNETIYFNLLPEFQELRCYLRANQKGQVLPPGGSPRDLFLYVREEYIDKAVDLLRHALGERADIFLLEDLIQAGLFGVPQPSKNFMKRAGNVVILPRGNGTIWWYEKNRFEMKLRGLHGGLSRDEMEIPLIIYQP